MIRRLVLIFSFALSNYCSAQEVIYSAPVEESYEYDDGIYGDGDYYVAWSEKKSSYIYLWLFKKGTGKVSGIEMRSGETSGYKTFSGYSADENAIYLYFLSSAETKMVTFYKDGRQPVISNLVLPGRNEKDDGFANFTVHNKSYQIQKNNRDNSLILYKVFGQNADLIGKFVVPEKTYRIIRNLKFTFISEDVDDINASAVNKIYLRGDRVIFSYHDLSQYSSAYRHGYLILNIADLSVSDREVSKGHDNDDFLLNDRLFLLKPYMDSLIFEVKNLEDFKLLKKIVMNKSTGPVLKSTRYTSTTGDSLDKLWKPKNEMKLLLKEIKNGQPTVTARKELSGSYTITIGSSILLYTHGSGGVAGAAPIVTGSYAGGDFEYFKGCLTEEFEPLPCSIPLTSWDKARMRKLELKKQGTKKFGMFSIMQVNNQVLLKYIDQTSDTRIIEKF